MRILQRGLKPFVGETKEERDAKYDRLRRDRDDKIETDQRERAIAAQARMNRIMKWGIAIAAIVALAIGVVQHVDSTHASQEDSSVRY